MKSDGSVELELNGRTITLVPNVRAFTTISRQSGGVREAYDAVLKHDLDTIVRVIVAGSDLSKKQIQELPQLVYESGMLKVMGPIAVYLSVLMNGGRPLDEVEDSEEDSSEGNE